MAICINLLAEAHAAEEQRRKDPVKRTAVVAGFVVFVVILWATTLQLRIMASKSELSSLDAKWKRIEKSYQTAVDAQRAAMDAEQKLIMLYQMSTNRFLWGSVFNALQQSFQAISDVQAIRLRTEQAYVMTEEIKPRTNGNKIMPGKPPSSTERISMTIDAIDTGAQPGANVNVFREAIANVPFFKENLSKTNGVLLTSRSAPQAFPSGNGQLVTFALQCNFPEKTR